MPPLVHEQGDVSGTNPAGQQLAILAETLYLVNLLLLPGMGFLILVAVYLKKIDSAPPLAACHLRQTLSASLWAGAVLIVISLVIIAIGGHDRLYTWVVLILYFTICHSTLVVFGAVGLSKAMAGRPYRYPMVGRPNP